MDTTAALATVGKASSSDIDRMTVVRCMFMNRFSVMAHAPGYVRSLARQH
jgi:hypothetical protein